MLVLVRRYLTEGADMLKATCVECERVFDLMNMDDLAEFSYGHDCEAS